MGGCRPLLPPMYFNVTVPLNNSALCHYFQSLANYCMQQKKWAPQVQHRWNLGVSVQKLIRCLLSDGGQKCLDTLLFPPLYREKWNSMWKAVYPLVLSGLGREEWKSSVVCSEWLWTGGKIKALGSFLIVGLSLSVNQWRAFISWLLQTYQSFRWPQLPLRFLAALVRA